MSVGVAGASPWGGGSNGGGVTLWGLSVSGSAVGQGSAPHAEDRATRSRGGKKESKGGGQQRGENGDAARGARGSVPRYMMPVGHVLRAQSQPAAPPASVEPTGGGLGEAGAKGEKQSQLRQQQRQGALAGTFPVVVRRSPGLPAPGLLPMAATAGPASPAAAFADEGQFSPPAASRLCPECGGTASRASTHAKGCPLAHVLEASAIAKAAEIERHGGGKARSAGEVTAGGDALEQFDLPAQRFSDAGEGGLATSRKQGPGARRVPKSVTARAGGGGGLLRKGSGGRASSGVAGPSTPPLPSSASSAGPSTPPLPPSASSTVLVEAAPLDPLGLVGSSTALANRTLPPPRQQSATPSRPRPRSQSVPKSEGSRGATARPSPHGVAEQVVGAAIAGGALRGSVSGERPWGTAGHVGGGAPVLRRSLSTTRARASGGSPAKSPSKKRPEWQSLEQSSPRKSVDVEAEMKRARERVEARQKQMRAAVEKVKAEEARRAAEVRESRSKATRDREKRQCEVYALNALLRMCEEARVEEYKSALEGQQAGAAEEAAAGAGAEVGAEAGAEAGAEGRGVGSGRGSRPPTPLPSMLHGV